VGEGCRSVIDWEEGKGIPGGWKTQEGSGERNSTSPGKWRTSVRTLKVLLVLLTKSHSYKKRKPRWYKFVYSR
jgi:hypothetical protein